MSHLVGYQDIILSSRNIYGGAFQLLHDWFRKPGNLNVAVEFFDGYEAADFQQALAGLRRQHSERLRAGRQIYVYLESPCNPHGYVLDVPAICQAAHDQGSTVILDATVGTPFLTQPLRREQPAQRPDFLIHSYTKDITGSGATTAGVVIARNERMFIPKQDAVNATDLSGRPVTYRWNETLFWNVFYVKGAFLDADKAFEVITGSRTLDLRMLRKAISTTVLAHFLGEHPRINVKCNALRTDPNSPLRERVLRLGLPAPLFTMEFAEGLLDRIIFTRFFDCLEPGFGHQVSLGQSNTVVLCPALTSHSEMSPNELRQAGISPTTIRISVGDEDPRQLIAHFIKTAELVLDPVLPNFSSGFMTAEAIDELYRTTYLDMHNRWLQSQPSVRALLS
jgi:O-acetylhomoserine/O-acetylserine sulfhydrylase-like pyridoxal-dependent enzyme